MNSPATRLAPDAVFAPLIDPEFAAPIIEHLRLLGDVLGEPRDAEVLHAWLHLTADTGPRPRWPSRWTPTGMPGFSTTSSKRAPGTRVRD